MVAMRAEGFLLLSTHKRVKGEIFFLLWTTGEMISWLAYEQNLFILWFIVIGKSRVHVFINYVKIGIQGFRFLVGIGEWFSK